ncbi:MAG TPA: DALR domain-containing protein, partial [Tissierellaceae bacterium]|nr:DALR domain-containing protein [Tissierellaceae bacterium]
AALFDLVKYTNSNFSEESSRKVVQYGYDTLMKLAMVLGILTKKDEILDDEIQKLIEDRNEARKNKDFAKADQIRDGLLDQGIVLEDTRDGVKWKRV